MPLTGAEPTNPTDPPTNPTDPPTRYYAEYAWLGGTSHAGSAPLARGVLIEIADGRFAAVTPEVPVPPAGTVRLAGLSLPGLANAHSHAFHRALRGRVPAAPGGGNGSFWRWRSSMYAVAERLDPDSYHALARAVYAEMALAGITCVGEFHYLHHGHGGTPYSDPNAMSEALVAAATDAGIRITLLDTCYLAAGVDADLRAGALADPQAGALAGAQARFGDGDVAAWAARAGAFAPHGGHAVVGAAVHSVRAVPAPQIPEVVAWAKRRGAPLHVHLSEQPAENAQCQRRYGRSPTQVLADAGALGPGTTAIHATHVAHADRRLLGTSGTRVCLCPTTERELGDGIGPARALVAEGVRLCLGSDSQTVVDLFAEAHAVEAHERLRTGRMWHFGPDELLVAATVAGHAALGWPDAGTIAPGQRADLVTVALDSVRTAGADPAGAIFAATGADVTQVLVDGRTVVRDGTHTMLPDTGAALAAAIRALDEPEGGR